jgi:hypothetical protein
MAGFPQQVPAIGSAGGTANALTFSVFNAPSYDNIKNVVLTVLATGTNSGAATFSVNSFTAHAILKPTQSGLAALTGGEIVSGVYIQLFWDGSNFILCGPVPPPGFTPIVIVHGSASFAAGDRSFVVPDHVTSIFVYATGGGGGGNFNPNITAFLPLDVGPGGSGFNVTTDAGSGGAGGTTIGAQSCTPGDTINFHVGRAGGASAAGEQTTFGIFTANGGQPSSGNSGGAGGTAAGGTSFVGGNGAAGQVNIPLNSAAFPRIVPGGASFWGGGPGAGGSGGGGMSIQIPAQDGIVLVVW